MSWEDVQEARHLQVQARQAACRLPRPDREGRAVPDRLGQDRDLFDAAGQHHRLDEDAVRLRDPGYIPKWIEPFESLNQPEDQAVPVPPDQRRTRAERTHSIFNNIPWLRETFSRR
jgi:hypothetical protein